MMLKQEVNKGLQLEDYLRLFEPYEAQLRDFKVRDVKYGGRFALLFRQVVNLLVRPSVINDQLPRTFIEVARRFLDNHRDTVMHFSYEDNRHFYLSDLMDWLQHQERARRMRHGG